MRSAALMMAFGWIVACSARARAPGIAYMRAPPTPAGAGLRTRSGDPYLGWLERVGRKTRTSQDMGSLPPTARRPRGWAGLHPPHLRQTELNGAMGEADAEARRRMAIVQAEAVVNGTRRAAERPPAKRSESGLFVLEDCRAAEYNFTQVGGCEDVKVQLLQVLDMMRNKEKYSAYGLRTPKGLLLEGPTGNGKTLLARCFAGEAGLPFISASGSEFTEKYVGVGASRIRELFQFAKEHRPCIVFVDEMDALGRTRSDQGVDAGAERDQTLNQLLVMMDGYAKTDNILVLAATNRVDILDRALLRPGRFDKIIHIPNPDEPARRKILEIHLKDKPITASIEDLVLLTRGLNGAQIENLLNEAVLYGIREGGLPVGLETVDRMRESLLVGQSTASRKTLNAAIRRRVAIHEVGHLLMALQSATYDRPWKITIDSMNQAHSLGYTLFDPVDEDTGLFMREYFYDRIKVLLGGRIAEEIVYGDSISSGAHSDLKSALAMAHRMVIDFGMGNERVNHGFSDSYKKRIDDQVRRLLRSAADETLAHLRAQRPLMERYVDALLRKNSLYRHEILQIYHENDFASAAQN